MLEKIIPLSPLLNAALIVQVHVIVVLIALILGPCAMLRRSRDIWHRWLGYAWLTAITLAALSSFAIHEARQVGPFSNIPLLSIFTLWQLWRGVGQARAGRIAAHRQTMLGLYVYTIGVAGLFTFLPGRRMNNCSLRMCLGWGLPGSQPCLRPDVSGCAPACGRPRGNEPFPSWHRQKGSLYGDCSTVGSRADVAELVDAQR